MMSFLAKLWAYFKRLCSTDGNKANRILCVDDDPDFCAYIEGLASPLGLEVEKAYSMEQAKQKIEMNSNYAVFIIDGHLLDGSGFELVAWIKEKQKLNQPIIFLSRIYQDAASFRILKENLKVNYVLEKPIKTDELKYLLSELTFSSKEPFPDSLLDEAKAHYQKTIFDKIERIERIIQSVQNHPSVENLQALRLEVHKLAGSSGSYGYSKVSLLCKDLEMDLVKQIELAKESKSDADWLNSLNQFFAELKAGFQDFSSEKKASTSFEASCSSVPSIYIVEDSPLIIEAWKKNIPEKMHVEVEADPQQALKRLISSDLSNQVIVISAKFKKEALQLEGYEVLEAAQAHEGLGLATFGLSLDSKNWQDLAEAIKRRVPLILIGPPTEQTLNFLKTYSLQQKAYYKILVIDDDLDVTQYIRESLDVLGFDIKTLNDSLLLQQALMEAYPALLIVDIDLSDPKKADILSLLQKISFKGLLIALVTIKQESDLIKKIYGSAVDDVLFKPLESKVLQKRVLSLLRKSFKSKKESLEYPQKDKQMNEPPTVWIVQGESLYSSALNQLFQGIGMPIQLVLVQEVVSKFSPDESAIYLCIGSAALENAQVILQQLNVRKGIKMQVIYLSELSMDVLGEFFEKGLDYEGNLYHLMLVIEK